MKRHEDGKFGIIYVLKMGEYYKIGKASLTFARLGEYTKLPEVPEYIYIGIVLNPLIFEEKLHKIFSHKRVRGEWFNLSVQDLNSIGLSIDANCLFRVDDYGFMYFYLDEPSIDDLLIKAKYLYSQSKSFDYNREYVLSIIKQREFLRKQFKKYDESSDFKMTFLYNPKCNIVENL